MSIERLDIKRLLAPDMRAVLEEPTMTDILFRCGGAIVSSDKEWYAQVSGVVIRGTVRADVLRRALDFIAIRSDLWPPDPPSAA